MRRIQELLTLGEITAKNGQDKARLDYSSKGEQVMQTEKPRIALISVHGDPAVDIGSEEAGGQNVYVRQVGEALARLGWQVDMFTRQAEANQPAIVEHCSGCRTIRLSAGPAEFIPRQEIFGYLDRFVEEWLEFTRHEAIAYRLIHTNYWLSAWVGLQLKQRLGLPMTHTYHSLGAVKYQSVEEPPETAQRRLEIEKTCLESADRIIATSPQEQQDMRSLVSEKGRITIIPCGTDVRRFGSIRYRQARERLGIDTGTRLVFYVGRFDPRKGIETLIRAVGQSKLRGQVPLRLIVGGGFRPGKSDGKERDRLAQLVTELGMDEFTEFPGRIADEDLPTYYAAADVCVVPSHYEPFGLVPIEAMASGTPVVASNVGGLKYTIAPEETGLLVSPKDVEGFAEAIDRILSNSQWRASLGDNGRARVEEMFSWEGVANQLSELYQELISQHQPSQVA